MNIPQHLNKVREVSITRQELIDFEDRVKVAYEAGQIKGPVHLSKNNEDELLKIFQYIHPEDWVFSAWRNHYHALLHGVDPEKLFSWISEGRSMGTNNVNPNFYASSIVGGIIPIALGVAMGLKRQNSPRRVWCFIGDMTMETGVFHESHKYAANFELPLQFVVEDNNLSVHTPTDIAWKKRMHIPTDVIYYPYIMHYPHHGTGKWVNF
jgi:pyruvate dehydrogenase E1 component alpha subunit